MAEMAAQASVDTHYVTVRELNQQTGEVLRRVEAGETLIVTKNGREVAMLGPAPRGTLARLRATGQVRSRVRGFHPLEKVAVSASTAQILGDLREDRL